MPNNLKVLVMRLRQRMRGKIRVETIHSGACAVFLLIAASPQWPYFMYVVLRVFICCSSAYIASRLYSKHRVPLVWLFGAIALVFNPVLPVRMARSDWEVINVLTAMVFVAFSVYLTWEKRPRRAARGLRQTDIVIRAAAAICEEMNGQVTRILELDAADSSLSDFLVVTSAANHHHAIIIADGIVSRLKRDFNLCTTLEDRNRGWILLDYGEFGINIFLPDQRAFYDIEGVRKSAKSFTITEFDKSI